jgi:protein-S-isoprenylcysteine O-methyltransferase Ste14
MQPYESSSPRHPAGLPVKTGNFLFRYRNGIGPVALVLALLVGQPSYPFGRADLDLAFDVAGALVALAGQALRILTIGFEYIERGGRNRQVYASSLVQGGVFGQSRNPLYVGNILICAGLALVVNSWAFYLLMIPFVLLTYFCIVAAEEAFLRDKFGQEYEAYCRRVPRWLPRWSGWQRSTEGMRFNWRRVLVKEYNTVLLLLLSLVALRLWSEYRVIGPGAAPPAVWLLAGLALWMAIYVAVRMLKKSGFVQG